MRPRGHKKGTTEERREKQRAGEGGGETKKKGRLLPPLGIGDGQVHLSRADWARQRASRNPAAGQECATGWPRNSDAKPHGFRRPTNFLGERTRIPVAIRHGISRRCLVTGRGLRRE